MAAAYERVREARSGQRPTSADFINSVFDDFIELHGDRAFSDDHAVIGGVARLGNRPVTVIGIEKGHTAKERVYRNFGQPGPEGYRKALRLMKQAEKFGRPLVCFIDTAGAYCGIGAEERGQGHAIALNLYEMSALNIPIVSVFIGEGGSGGALALAAADRVWMLENAVYSVISPEGCASILWKDSSRAEQAAEHLRLTADDALSLGIADRIISEEGLGTESFFTRLSSELSSELTSLSTEKTSDLKENRYNRFRKYGVFSER